MSRSYNKTVKMPFCVVNHRAMQKWHKDERKRRKRYYKNKLRQQLLYNIEEDIVDILYSSFYDKGFKDSWMSPADGNIRIYKYKNNNLIIRDNSFYNKENKDYWYNKYKRK